MVRLTFSNALEPLTVALASDIEKWREGDLGRLLCPLPIAVPDRLVARYINLEVARRLGASINLRFPFLSGVLESTLGPTLAPRLLTRERIAERLAIALGDEELLSDPTMTPARVYIQTGDASSAATRRAELAAELTRLFLDYSATRPTDFVRFAEGAGDFGEASGWQRLLWRRVIEPTDDSKARLAPLVELVTSARDDELNLPPIVFVVGASNTAPSHRLMLERLAQSTTVHIYAFNPCREFWEDLEKSPDECPALAYWGRAGRSPVRQLSELAQFDFETMFAEPTGNSVLARLKDDMLSRQSGADSRAPLAFDKSVKIIVAPNIRRELEQIGESIWQLARETPDLSLSQIGVLLAGSELDLYRAQIGSVFESLASLPHHISLVPLLEESRVAEAFGWLLALPLGSFTRPEMLKVLTHPSILGGDGEVDPADWVRWIRDLGVFFGADATVHRETYLEGDVYHWDQALLRLSLGACVERDPNERPVQLANRVVLPHAQTGDRRRSAARLGLLARSLIADVTWLRKQRMPLAAWADVLWRFASAYINVDEPNDDRASAELGRCRLALSRLGDPNETQTVPMTTAIKLAEAALAGLETRRGEPLTEGVCIAPLTSPPLIPFRHLFVAGLSSGSFPKSDSPGIDARAKNRGAGEPSASDRDRYAFLHALFCASESITVSHVGRDPNSGEALPPSAVVAELAHLSRRELTPAAARSMVTEVPTFAHSDAGTEERGVNLRGRRQAQARTLAPPRKTLRASQSRRLLLESLRRKARPQTRELLGLEAPDQTSRPRADRELSTSELARFLDSPIDAWGRTVLGLGDPDDSGRTHANEPLDLSPLDRWAITREAVCGLLIKGPSHGDLRSRITAAANRRLLSSTGPSGDVAQWQVEAALEETEAWWQVLQTLAPITKPTSLAIGRAREGADVAELLPPLVVGNDPFVETHGLFQLVASDASAQIYFHRDTLPASRRSRALVDHLLLAACNRVDTSQVAIHFVGTRKAQSLELDAFNVAEARKMLELLSDELLYGDHAYELPGNAVIANHLSGHEPTTDLERLAAAPRRSYSMSIERRPGDFSLPSDLDEIIERRYKPLLARLRRTK